MLIKSSYLILDKYLELLGIDIDANLYIKPIDPSIYEPSTYSVKDSLTYLDTSLIDVTRSNSDLLLKIYASIQEHTDMGRSEKNIIRNFLNKNDIKGCNTYINKLIGYNYKLHKFLVDNSYDYDEVVTRARNSFSLLFTIALNSNDKNKITDYLQTLYSKLLSENEFSNVKLSKLCAYNDKYSKGALSPEFMDKLRKKCQKNDFEGPLDVVAKMYNKYYQNLRIIEDSHYYSVNPIIKGNNLDITGIFSSIETESTEVAYLDLNQDLFMNFSSEDKFKEYCIGVVAESYRIIKNHGVLSVKVGNIVNNKGRNIKWDIYSEISVYAEKFIEEKDESGIYQPWILLYEELANLHSITIPIDYLKLYYTGKKTIEELYACIDKPQISLKVFCSIANRYEKINHGFSFTDAFILEYPEEFYQSPALSEIKNSNEVLLVFYKHRRNSVKIPCPSCAGLNISSNSYTEINLQSWECKNEFCPDRSKSNRGKRYSLKSNMMQSGLFDIGNHIEKELINKWRRDIVKITSEDEIITMLSNYYVYNKGSITAFNYRKPETKIKNKIFNNISFNSNYSELTTKENYVKFFDKSNFMLTVKMEALNNPTPKYILDLDETTLFCGTGRNVLANVRENTVALAVTSPPYFNARDYSNWPNILLYLLDMKWDLKSVYNVLKGGSVYLYNVGDISGNENLYTKSSMGKKRIILGAYIILLAKLAGFEVLDNLIWDKGEPQSNRQKNDGKNTTHYQRPMNVYEHMFILTKKNSLMSTKKRTALWQSNIAPLSPVIKINSKGENTLGHTAPFPRDIPAFAITYFTKKGDVVLDPYSGSLTTVIEAGLSERIGIGIEISKEYCDLSLNIAKKKNVHVVFNTNFEIKLLP